MLYFWSYYNWFYLLNNYRLRKNFSNLDEYLTENIYFNHSKNSVSCVYLSILNLKWVKDKFQNENNCSPKRSFTPKFYFNLLSTCISDIKVQKENGSYFMMILKKLLGKK